MKQTIKLTEAKLRSIIQSVIRESMENNASNIGQQFINFIEKYKLGGMTMLQTVIDFESGEETGMPTSPLPSIIPEFEKCHLGGQKCTPEMRQEIKRAYTEWWNSRKDQLLPDDAKNDYNPDGTWTSSGQPYSNNIGESRIKNMITNIVNESLRKYYI